MLADFRLDGGSLDALEPARAAAETYMLANVLRSRGNVEAVLHLSWRPDGGLRIHSPTHPGLVLSNKRADLVMLDVLPVLAVMGFAASGTDARSVETEGLDPKDDGPAPQEDAHD